MSAAAGIRRVQNAFPSLGHSQGQHLWGAPGSRQGPLPPPVLSHLQKPLGPQILIRIPPYPALGLSQRLAWHPTATPGILESQNRDCLNVHHLPNPLIPRREKRGPETSVLPKVTRQPGDTSNTRALSSSEGLILKYKDSEMPEGWDTGLEREERSVNN